MQHPKPAKTWPKARSRRESWSKRRISYSLQSVQSWRALSVRFGQIRRISGTSRLHLTRPEHGRVTNRPCPLPRGFRRVFRCLQQPERCPLFGPLTGSSSCTTLHGKPGFMPFARCASTAGAIVHPFALPSRLHALLQMLQQRRCCVSSSATAQRDFRKGVRTISRSSRRLYWMKGIPGKSVRPRECAAVCQSALPTVLAPPQVPLAPRSR